MTPYHSRRTLPEIPDQNCEEEQNSSCGEPRQAYHHRIQPDILYPQDERTLRSGEPVWICL